MLFVSLLATPQSPTTWHMWLHPEGPLTKMGTPMRSASLSTTKRSVGAASVTTTPVQPQAEGRAQQHNFSVRGQAKRWCAPLCICETGDIKHLGFIALPLPGW